MLTIHKLATIAKIVNLKALCEEAGLNNQTLQTKVRRGTELKESEIRELTRVLQFYGVDVDKIPDNFL